MRRRADLGPHRASSPTRGEEGGSVRCDAEQTQVRTELPLPQGARKGEREMRRRADPGPHRASSPTRGEEGGSMRCDAEQT